MLQLHKLDSKGFAHHLILLLAVVIVAIGGSYYIVTSHADNSCTTSNNPNCTTASQDETLLSDNPARGLIYDGKKVKTTGPCKGEFDLTKTYGNGRTALCGHIDPGPDGVDVRQRSKQVDSDLSALVDKDTKKAPVASTSTDPSLETSPGMAAPNDISYAGSLSAVTPRHFPCYGTGEDGDRVGFVYVYVGSSANRLSSLAPGFNAIAGRMNQIMYASSGQAWGGATPVHKQIRFRTWSVTSAGDCTLKIGAVHYTGASVNSYGSIVQAVKTAGLNRSNHKYIVEVDGGSGCGQGGVYDDNQPSLANANNTGPSYAVIWHPCWNYAEPHEFGHTLGSVMGDSSQPGGAAPYSTPGYHCRDLHDVMCYNDGTLPAGQQMVTRCSNTASEWLYDCDGDSYFNSTKSVTGWLSSHWNTAHSSWLL